MRTSKNYFVLTSCPVCQDWAIFHRQWDSSCLRTVWECKFLRQTLMILCCTRSGFETGNFEMSCHQYFPSHLKHYFHSLRLIFSFYRKLIDKLSLWNNRMGRIIHNRTNRKDHLINKQNITQGADQVLTGLRILPEDSSYLYKYVGTLLLLMTF